MRLYGLSIGIALSLLASGEAFAYDTNYLDFCTKPRISGKPAEEGKKDAEIVFYGDSRMESTCNLPDKTTNTYATTLPQAVAWRLDIANDKIKERARDATSTADLNWGIYTPKWTVDDYLGTTSTDPAEIEKLKKIKVVVLAFGTNDLWYDDDPKKYTPPLPPSGDVNASFKFKDRLKRMAEVALAAGKSVVLVEPYQACKYGTYYYRSVFNEGVLLNDEKDDVIRGEEERVAYLFGELQRYVDDIHTVSNDLNANSAYTGRVVVAPLYGVSLKCREAETDTNDGLHATQATIIRMAEVVKDAISKVYPIVTAHSSNASIVLDAYPRQTFHWDAKYASSVTVQCSGSVTGSYSGTSLKDAIYMQTTSGGPGTCKVTARNDTGQTAETSQEVTVQVPPPSISTSVSAPTLVLGNNRTTVFSWDAQHASTVTVACSGAVTGVYSGLSLVDAIFVEPVYAGSGTCTATAHNDSNQQAFSTQNLTVLSDVPTITSSVGSSTLSLGGSPTIFSWSASSNTRSVKVRCTGSVTGDYDGPSLQNGIYARPVSPGNGRCSATAYSASGKTSDSFQTMSVH